jgi:hypothetical protein
MEVPTKQCCYDMSLLTFYNKNITIMDNLDELERQRAANRERQRRRREQGSQEERDIVNKSRRLNHQQSDSERETHTERSRLS